MHCPQGCAAAQLLRRQLYPDLLRLASSKTAVDGRLPGLVCCGTYAGPAVDIDTDIDIDADMDTEREITMETFILVYGCWTTGFIEVGAAWF